MKKIISLSMVLLVAGCASQTSPTKTLASKAEVLAMPPQPLSLQVRSAIAVNPPPVNIITDTILITPSPDLDATGVLIMDGPAPGVYNETNDAGTNLVYVLNTTNALPIYINAVAYDAAGNKSDLAEPTTFGFNGLTIYAVTNLVTINNPSGSNMMCGPDLLLLNTPTNFSSITVTNPAPGMMLFSGYGLTISRISTHLTMLTPMP